MVEPLAESSGTKLTSAFVVSRYPSAQIRMCSCSTVAARPLPGILGALGQARRFHSRYHLKGTGKLVRCLLLDRVLLLDEPFGALDPQVRNFVSTHPPAAECLAQLFVHPLDTGCPGVAAGGSAV